jgi:hypothetical protein
MDRRIYRTSLTLLLIGGVAAMPLASQPLGFPLPEGPYRPDVPTPDRVLGFSFGQRPITPEEAFHYLEALAQASPRIRVETYGQTFEGRPLRLAWVSTPENLARLETWQRRWRDLWNPVQVRPSDLDDWLAEGLPLLVWFGFSIHGNEHSSTEAALALAYFLAASEAPEVQRVLERVVLLIDPVQNPDGRSRFVQHVRTQMGRQPDEFPWATEHTEEWPSGRWNHFLYDLNRDWLFQTQLESQARVAAYVRHPPQVFVDFHEMGRDETYFFPPPTRPIIPWLPASLRAWWERFGQANARAFEQKGWRYFTREWFDTYYPGYGDSFPALNGAVGMTYEQASARGVRVRRSDGTVLTLSDAIAHHWTTAWTTLQTAAEHRAEILRDFFQSRASHLRDAEDLWGWLVPADTDPFLRQRLWERLQRMGVEVHTVSRPVTVSARDPYFGGPPTRIDVRPGDWLIPLRQAQRLLLKVWLDREVPMEPEFLATVREQRELREEPGFYDITGWSLPLAWNLRVVELTGRIDRSLLQPVQAGSDPTGPVPRRATYAYVLCNRTLGIYAAAASALEHRLPFYINRKPLHLGSSRCPPGSLIFFVASQLPEFESWIETWARRLGPAVLALDSGWTTDGISLSSPQTAFVPSDKRIALLVGPGTRPDSVGALWHTLEVVYGFPVTRIRTDMLASMDWSDVGVLILADVAPSVLKSLWRDETVQRLKLWLESGGALIAIGSGAVWASEVGLMKVEWGPEKKADEKEKKPPTLGDVPGALLWVRLEPRHFWMGGYETPDVAVFYEGKTMARPDPEVAFVVARFAPADRLKASGFVWDDTKTFLADTAYAWYVELGRGRIFAILGHPMFRGDYWGTHRFALNALLWGLAR